MFIVLILFGLALAYGNATQDCKRILTTFFSPIYSEFHNFYFIKMHLADANADKNIWTDIEKSISYSKKNSTRQDSTFGTGDRTTIVDGDIVQDPYEDKLLLAPTQILRPGFSWHKRLWKRIIPYVISPELRHATSKFLKAFTRIENISCLRFRRKISSDRDWMEYYIGNGCHSGIGRRYHSRGRARISIGKFCDSVPTILHETLHSLGFWHEQNREDRDSFVNIYKHHVNDIGSDQFWKAKVGTQNYFGTPYDYQSIMQYSKKTFIKPYVKGNVIEAKFDPNIKLGGLYMSPLDKVELNKLYQCHVKSGWSDWTDWSQCLPNKGQACTRASVRYCVSLNWNECPGAGKYGVQENVVNCDPDLCPGGLPVNGNWGKWGAYSLCNSKCGWGTQTRYRKCDNPTPRNKGRECAGSSREKYLCRRPRCVRPNGADNNFEYGKRGWTLKGFTVKSGKASWLNSGPTSDHTSIVTGLKNGKYALATKVDNTRRKTEARLISPTIYSFSGNKCFMFYYQMNGEKIYHDRALSLYVKEIGGRYLNFAFTRSGHQGNYWKRAAINISGIRKPFKIGIIAKFELGRADIAIDDIFFDHEPCLKGLEKDGCHDLLRNCEELAKRGKCKVNKHQMMRECCKSCSNPAYDNWRPTEKPFVCKDTRKNCNFWFLQGECENNRKWMNKNCCLSCKKRRVCKKDLYESKKEEANCKTWASVGECITNPKFMLHQCCRSCKEAKCVDKYKSCRGWGRLKYCTTGEKQSWFKKNCCETCVAIKAPKLCTAKSNSDKLCEKWAKEGECSQNSWMAKNCCPACKEYA